MSLDFVVCMYWYVHTYIHTYVLFVGFILFYFIDIAIDIFLF